MGTFEPRTFATGNKQLFNRKPAGMVQGSDVSEKKPSFFKRLLGAK